MVEEAVDMTVALGEIALSAQPVAPLPPPGAAAPASRRTSNNLPPGPGNIPRPSRLSLSQSSASLAQLPPAPSVAPADTVKKVQELWRLGRGRRNGHG